MTNLAQPVEQLLMFLMCIYFNVVHADLLNASKIDLKATLKNFALLSKRFFFFLSFIEYC